MTTETSCVQFGNRLSFTYDSSYLYIQNMYTLFNTILTHMFIISSILTVADGGSNDIYVIVSR